MIPVKNYTEHSTDLECPYCGSDLELKTGRYGIFYGCAAYDSTKCTGAVSCDQTTARPYGRIVDRETRYARRDLILRLLKHLSGSKIKEHAGPNHKIVCNRLRIKKTFSVILNKWVSGKLGIEIPDKGVVSLLNKEQCSELMKLLEAEIQEVENGHSRYGRFMSDDLL